VEQLVDVHAKEGPQKARNLFFFVLFCVFFRFIKTQLGNLQTFILHEGHREWQFLLPGALSLGIDVVRNEKQEGLEFENFFIDCGTGISAAGLILGLAALHRKGTVHVMTCRPDHGLWEILEKGKLFLEEKLSISIPLHLLTIQTHQPPIAPSFGSVNTEVFKCVKRVAREQGFFLDPIYSAKLFTLMETMAPTLKGPSLFIHSGGALSLFGFQEKLAAV
jgi:D-cysteine desulfhydrase